FYHCGSVVPVSVDAGVHEVLSSARPRTVGRNDLGDDWSKFIDDLHCETPFANNERPGTRNRRHRVSFLKTSYAFRVYIVWAISFTLNLCRPLYCWQRERDLQHDDSPKLEPY